MANPVKSFPSLPRATTTGLTVQALAQYDAALNNALFRELSEIATRLNNAYMKDGSEPLEGPLLLEGSIPFTIEQGTFTPTIDAVSVSPTVTYTLQEGNFLRILDWVQFNLRISINTISGGTGNALIGGMPFPMPATNVLVGTASTSGVDWPSGSQVVAFSLATGGATEPDTLQLVTQQDNGGQTNIDIAGLAASDVIRVAGAYNLDA